MLNFLLLSGGLVLLILGANLLVSGASSIARRFKVSYLVIGLTIVAFGTSMPELVVNLIAGYSGNTGIAMGNILGSNIANVFIILGLAALIRPMNIQNRTIRIEIPFSFLAAILVWICANDVLIDNAPVSSLSRIDGIVFICFFIIFLYYSFFSGSAETVQENGEADDARPIWKSGLFIMGGLIMLYFGGELIVKNAVEIARSLQIEEEIIGLTIVAIGTSLPELATSVIAAYKGNSDIAIGNVVGSNIFNIFFILGATSLIRPIPYNSSYNSDLILVIAGSILLLLFMTTGKKRSIDRWEGGLLLIFYAVYMFLRVSGIL
jgi:cation:H+ antiporter